MRIKSIRYICPACKEEERVKPRLGAKSIPIEKRICLKCQSAMQPEVEK